MSRFKKTISYFISALMVLFLFNVSTFAAVVKSEIEPNNSVSTATLIPSNFDFTQEIGGSIESAGDVDYYKFVPTNPGGYSITTLGTTDTFGYLYDSNMNLLDVSDDQLYPSDINFELRYTLSAGVTYYIKVTHKNATGTGNYSLKITPTNYTYKGIEPNGSFITATQVDPSTTTPAIIGSPGDEDYYLISLSGGGKFSFETIGSTDTYGYLYDGSHNLIASDDNSGEGNNMKIISDLAGQRSYFIRVRHALPTGIGSYSLKITPVPSYASNDYEGNDFSSAMQLNTTENYASYSCAIMDNSNDADFFKFTPLKDGIYTFESIGGINVCGAVYDSSHNLIKSDDNSGSDDNFMIDVPLTANQTYYLKVSSSDGSTGYYGLDIAKGKCLPVPNYLQLPYDELCWASVSSMTISYFNHDTIDRTVDIAKNFAKTGYASAQALYGPNYYTYPSVFNQPSNFTNCDTAIGQYVNSSIIHSATYCPGISTDPNAQNNPATHGESFICPNSEVIKSIDKGYPILYFVQNQQGGGHCLIVKGYKEDANGFNIIYNDPLDGEEHIGRLSSVGYTRLYPQCADVEPNNTIAEADYAPAQGSIDKPGDVDFYELWPTLGTQYMPPSIRYIIETTGTTDTYGELYDKDGNLIASSDNGGQGGNFKIDRELVTNQLYYIKVRHSGNGTGSYSLNLSSIYLNN